MKSVQGRSLALPSLPLTETHCWMCIRLSCPSFWQTGSGCKHSIIPDIFIFWMIIRRLLHCLLHCCHYSGQGQIAAYHLLLHWEGVQLQSALQDLFASGTPRRVGQYGPPLPPQRRLFWDILLMQQLHPHLSKVSCVHLIWLLQCLAHFICSYRACHELFQNKKRLLQLSPCTKLKTKPAAGAQSLSSCPHIHVLSDRVHTFWPLLYFYPPFVQKREALTAFSPLPLLPQVMFHLTTGSFLPVFTGPTGSLLTFNTWMSWTRSSATVETIFPSREKKGRDPVRNAILFSLLPIWWHRKI